MGSRIQGCKDSLEKSLHDDGKAWTAAFAWAENKTGVKRLYLFLISLTFLAVYMVIGFAAQLICNLVGFVYPAYSSMKALETKNKEDDTKWLTYWVVFALFSIVEYFSNMLLYWFPFYWLIKCLFHIWCFIPLPSNGSTVIYNYIIRPQFMAHQEQVDNVLSNIANSGTRTASQLVANALKTE